MRECYKPHDEVSNAFLVLIVFACLAAPVACRAPEASSLDTAATAYVRLAGGSERHDEEYRQGLASLHADVAALEERDGRRAFLLAQLAALARRARFANGERVSIRAEAAALGLDVPTFDASRAADLRARLDEALPGSKPLAERLAAYHRAHVVPRAQLDATARRLVADCRARTEMPADLRDGGVELRYVLEQPWPAFTRYRGKGSSVVDVRRDVAWAEEDLQQVLCHETYPGHHVQHLVWAGLHETRGWPELTVMPMHTPHALMAERAAVTATALLWPQEEQPAVQAVLTAFAPLAASVAVDVVDGAVERVTGLGRLREELLMPNAEEFVAFVERYRSMSLAYVTPAPDIHDWQSYLALLRSPARLVAGADEDSGR